MLQGAGGKETRLPPRIRIAPWIACALAAVTLTACSSGGPRPYVVRPSYAVTEAVEAESWEKAPTVISICYSSVLNTPEEVLEEARYQCNDGEVTLSEQDVVWTPCGLFQPRRATYICTRPNPAP